MPTAAVNGIELYYEDGGQGPALLLIPGLATDSQAWPPAILEALARRFRVVRVDNRGAGRTQVPPAEVTVAAMANDCRALLGHLGIASAHVLGHSMGGFVAQELAIRHPDAVDRLVLAATAPHNPPRNNRLLADFAAYLECCPDRTLWWRGFFYWLFSPALFADEGALDAALRFALENPWPQETAAFAAQVEACARFDRRREAGTIAAPTLVLAGERDLLFPPAECEALAAVIPGAALRVLPGAAHALYVEAPEAFTERVLEFIDATR